MALARTPPDDAISNLFKWAEFVGFHHAPAWLRDSTAYLAVSRWAKKTVIASSSIIVFGLIIYFWVPVPSHQLPSPKAASATKELLPIPFSDDEVHGWLKPANYPTPLNGCDGRIGNDAMKILIGDNGIAQNGYGRIVALQIGTCEALSIERLADGVFVDAELNDGSGLPPVRIKRNEIFAQNGETYSSRQTRDSSSITVKDKFGRIILDAQFLNSTTLKVSGMFGCTGGRLIHVSDGQPVPGFFMSHSCLANSRVGIRLD